MVADESSKAEEEEVDGGEDVGGGEGAPVGGEVSPHLHLGYLFFSVILPQKQKGRGSICKRIMISSKH